ncbi:MAG: phytoene desaturase family protein [Solirubrobacteraceae bacterium]
MRNLTRSRPALNRRPSDEADVIVVGAGHNGLTAACYLARQGLEVLVLEASEVIGGMTATRRAIDAAPAHWINEGSIDVTLFNTSTIASDLDLERFGLREIEVDPQAAFLGADGESLCLFRDVPRTLAEIRRFSPADAKTYAEFVELSYAALGVLLPYMASPPTRPSPRTILSALRLTLNRRQLRELGALITMSETELIDRFENPMLRGLIAGIVPMPSLRTDFGAYMLVYYAMCHRYGVHRFAGGTAGVAWALERCLTAAGGRVRTSALVDQVLVDHGTVTGVRLADGVELGAPAVLTSCSPKTTLTRLLPEGALSGDLMRRAAHIPTREAMTIKTDVAYSARLELSRHQAQRSDGADLRLPVWVYHTFEQLQAAETAARHGLLPDTLPTMVVIPTAADPAQTPAGQDTLWLFSSYLPDVPEADWDRLGPRAAQSVIDDLTGYIDGVGEHELGRQVNAPPGLAKRFNAVDGNVFHVDPIIPRFGPNRPFFGVGSHRGPLPGLFLTGAGTHPTPGICGVPGQLAARVVARDLVRGRAPARGLAPARGRAPAATRRPQAAPVPAVPSAPETQSEAVTRV